MKNYLNTIALKKKVPNDWCYVYNFDNPNEPIAKIKVKRNEEELTFDVEKREVVKHIEFQLNIL